MRIQEYVLQHTDRGECKCGKCIDAGDKPDPQGHTADMVFFKVVKRNDPTLEGFKKLTAEEPGACGRCDPLDGKEHNYMELGGWIGDQGLAMQYMALGYLLGAFTLLTPKTMLHIDGPEAVQMAGMGLLCIQAKP